MKKISYWAKTHRASAIVLLVLVKICLAVLAFCTGLLLQKTGISLGSVVFTSACAIALLGFSLYPAKRSWSNYAKRKCCDLLIAAGSFLVICCYSNNGQIASPIITSSYASVSPKAKKPTAEEILSSLKYRDKSTLTKKEKRILKKEFIRQLKKYGEAKLTGNKDGAETALLIILAIIAAAGLLCLLLALCCSIACSGSEALAIAVAVIGVAGIIIGFVAVVNAIHRKHYDKPKGG